MAQLLGELGLCAGLGLGAVAMVLALHSFVVFQGQKTSFLYAIPNDSLSDFRITVVLSAFGLGLAVVHMVYVQTQVTDVALVDWERPQQVRSIVPVPRRCLMLVEAPRWWHAVRRKALHVPIGMLRRVPRVLTPGR